MAASSALVAPDSDDDAPLMTPVKKRKVANAALPRFVPDVPALNDAKVKAAIGNLDKVETINSTIENLGQFQQFLLKQISQFEVKAKNKNKSK